MYVPQARLAVRRVAKKEITQAEATEQYGVPDRTMRHWLSHLKSELKLSKTKDLRTVPDEKLDAEIACLSIGKVGRPAHLKDDVMAVLVLRSVLMSLAGNEMSIRRVGDECKNLLNEMAELEEDDEIRARMAKAVCGPDVVKRGVELTEKMLGAHTPCTGGVTEECAVRIEGETRRTEAHQFCCCSSKYSHSPAQEQQQPLCLLSPHTGINLTFKKGSLISTARCIAGDPGRRIKFCSMLDSQFVKMYRDGKIPSPRPDGERMWNMDETQIADGARGLSSRACVLTSPAVASGDSERLRSSTVQKCCSAGCCLVHYERHGAMRQLLSHGPACALPAVQHALAEPCPLRTSVSAEKHLRTLLPVGKQGSIIKSGGGEKAKDPVSIAFWSNGNGMCEDIPLQVIFKATQHDKTMHEGLPGNAYVCVSESGYQARPGSASSAHARETHCADCMLDRVCGRRSSAPVS